MIEIRELVIRATVEDTSRSNAGKSGSDAKPATGNKKECCSETVDMLLQIINDKKER